MKIGVSVERIQSNQFTRGSSPNGFYTFGSLQSFLTNQPTNYVSLISASLSPRDLRQTLFGAYIQDDYKILPNLTLNLGLRYEMATVPTETANQLSTLVNFTDKSPNWVLPILQIQRLRNFAPRLGFAWDPWGKGKTSIHGAYGMYDVLPLPYQFELLTLLSAPFTLGGSFAFPTSGPQACNAPGVHCFPTGGFPESHCKYATKRLCRAGSAPKLRPAMDSEHPTSSSCEILRSPPRTSARMGFICRTIPMTLMTCSRSHTQRQAISGPQSPARELGSFPIWAGR